MISEKPKILVVGAGPVGLTMAAQLTRYGVPCRIVEKKPGVTHRSKAVSIHSRTMEMFEDMGVIQTALDRGMRCEAMSIFADGERIIQVTTDDLDSPFAFILNLKQSDTEAVLYEHLQSLGVEVEWQTELSNLEQNGEAVNVTLQKADGSTETISVDYVCACDGAHSFCRHALNLDFQGAAYPREFLLGDVQVDWSKPRDELFAYLSENGFMVAVSLTEGYWRMIVESPPERWRQRDASKGETPTLEDLQKVLNEIVPTPVGVSNPVWLSYFRINCRILDRFRHGRVFFAGDAAHIHSPVGGQGMNTGIHDAYNLAWKLGLVYQGIAQPQLLDSYDAERRPIAKDLLSSTDIVFKAILLRHPVLRGIRDRLASFLGSFEFFQHRLQRKIAMHTIGYRKSPIVAEHRPGIFQLGHDFGAAPNAGDRAIDATFLKGDPSSGRWAASNGDQATDRLFNLLKGTSHHLILFTGAKPTTAALESLSQIGWEVEQHFGNKIVPHLVIHGTEKPSALQWNGSLLLDPEGNFHRRYGAHFNCLYLIRPDNYIGFRSQPAKFEPLFKHCDRIFFRKTVSRSVVQKTPESVLT